MIDEYGKRIVACPTDEAEEYIRNRRNDIDETEQGDIVIANLESVSKGAFRSIQDLILLSQITKQISIHRLS